MLRATAAAKTGTIAPCGLVDPHVETKTDDRIPHHVITVRNLHLIRTETPQEALVRMEIITSTDPGAPTNVGQHLRDGARLMEHDQ